MGQSLGDLVITVAAGLDPLRKGLNQAAGLVESFGRNTAKSFGSMLSDPLRGLRPALTVAAGLGLAVGVHELAGGIRDTVTESVRLAAQWEKTAVSMEVMLGSADRAKSMMSDLRGFAAESPLSMTDATKQAQQLLAADVAPDQVVPTLRALSDLAAGDSEKLNRLSYAYTQVKSAGRLYGTELRQFTETGIPLVDALAKRFGTTKDQVKGLVEEGRVGFPDLVASVKAMTDVGGKFYGMTERGAGTLSGQFERLQDGIDELKREFGRAIVEEAGLSEAMKDGEKFLDRMKANVNDLRPAIRFTADLLKGAAQIGGELLRNGPLFARAFSDAFREANPNASRLLDKVADLVRQAKEFKLDPLTVVDVAVDVASAFGTAFDGVIGSLGDGLKGIYDTHIKPITDSIRTAADAWRAVSDPIKKANRIAEDMGATEDQFRSRIMADPLMEATNMKLARLGHEFKNSDPASEAAKSLKGQYRDLNLSMHLALGKQLDADLQQQRVLLHEFGRKAIGTRPDDIIPARAELSKLNSAATDARLNLEKSLYGSASPSQQLGAAFGLDKLRDKVRGMAREFAARDLFGDPLALNTGSVAGGLAGLATSLKQKPKGELQIPELTAAAGLREIKLPTAAEFGSQQAAEIFAQFAGRMSNPQLEESAKQTALLGDIARGVDRTAANLEQNVGSMLPAP